MNQLNSANHSFVAHRGPRLAGMWPARRRVGGKGGAMDLGLGFDQAAIGMALVGLDGRFQRVNRALCELLGRSEA